MADSQAHAQRLADLCGVEYSDEAEISFHRITWNESRELYKPGDLEALIRRGTSSVDALFEELLPVAETSRREGTISDELYTEARRAIHFRARIMLLEQLLLYHAEIGEPPPFDELPTAFQERAVEIGAAIDLLKLIPPRKVKDAQRNLEIHTEYRLRLDSGEKGYEIKEDLGDRHGLEPKRIEGIIAEVEALISNPQKNGGEPS